MSSKRKRRTLEHVPVESFSDIAFLLIIFFIVTTTLVSTKGFTAEVPSSDQDEQQKEEQKTHMVSLKGDEIYFDETKQANIEGLRASLRELELHEEEGEGKIIMLTASGGVQYELYYRTLRAITIEGGVPGIVRENTEE